MANPNQSDAGHSHDGSSELKYLMVFLALLVLTLIEVGITYLSMPRIAAVLGLLTFAFMKAALVAMYFMHLRFDPRVLTAIFVVPMLLGSVLIYFLTI